jgi:hypothetical protein
VREQLKNALELCDLIGIFGFSGRARTYNPSVNSRAVSSSPHFAPLPISLFYPTFMPILGGIQSFPFHPVYHHRGAHKGGTVAVAPLSRAHSFAQDGRRRGSCESRGIPGTRTPHRSCGSPLATREPLLACGRHALPKESLSMPHAAEDRQYGGKDEN